MTRYIEAEMETNSITQAINCVAWVVRKLDGQTIRSRSVGDMHTPIERRIYRIPLMGYLDVEAEYCGSARIYLRFMGDDRYSENIMSRLRRLGFMTKRDIREEYALV